jgi:hypothetical protein
MFRLSHFALLVAALTAACFSPARAADLAVKAPPSVSAFAFNNPCSEFGCTGFYAGAQVSGSGTGVNVLNLGSLNAGGTYMGVNGGYQFYNGVYWLGVGAKVEYAVASPPSDIVGGSFSNKVFAFEGIEVGGNLASMFNIAPLNLPGFLATAVPTIKIGACQNGNSLRGYCSGAAAHFFVPNSRWTIDAEYLNAQYGVTTTAPGVTANTENRGSMGFAYHF